jgi:hypothetical protein
VVHAGVNPTVYITRVVDETRPGILQIQKREKSIGIKLTTKLHVGVTTVLIDTIRSGRKK